MPPTPQRTTPLSTAVIVDVAITVARAEGLAAVTMRRLGRELEVSAMAAYRHFPDRESVLLAMLDRMVEQTPLPEPDPDPRADLVAVLTALRETFHRDIWLVQALSTEGLTSPVILPVVDRVFGALLGAGLQPRAARGVYTVLINYLFGDTLTVVHGRTVSFGRRMAPSMDPLRYPRLTEAMADAATVEDHFAENLDRILTGSLGE